MIFVLISEIIRALQHSLNSYQHIFEGGLLDDPNKYHYKEPPNAAANSSTFLAARLKGISIREETEWTGKLETRIMLFGERLTVLTNCSPWMAIFDLGQQKQITQD